jgi:alpha-galactosidase
MRPLSTSSATPGRLRLKHNPDAYDPTDPETLAKVADDVARLRSWGYALIKHDFSTFDILGRWGFAMGAEITDDGWTFREGRTRTTAEVIRALYETIRTAAGDALLVGCNTVGHLSAGIFEISRTGDDTSGRVWERTRRMGANSLAFRAPQHGAFHVVDADCVGLTPEIPWEQNRQWLDLLARSGTALFVSLPNGPVGAAEQGALRAAFAVAAVPRPVGEPLDALTTTCPEHWRFADGAARYHWIEPGGETPFSV